MTFLFYTIICKFQLRIRSPTTKFPTTQCIRKCVTRRNPVGEARHKGALVKGTKGPAAELIGPSPVIRGLIHSTGRVRMTCTR